MPNLSPDPNLEAGTQETALALPDVAAAQYLNELAESTMQWVTYANEQAQAGNTAEVAAALVTINSQVAEWQQNTAVVVGAQREMLQQAIAQRDELVREVEQKDEQIDEMQEAADLAEWQIEAVSEEAFVTGRDEMMETLYDDPEIAEDLYDRRDEVFVEDAQALAARLRTEGKIAEADEVEEQALRAVQARSEAKDLFDKRQAEYYERLTNRPDVRAETERIMRLAGVTEDDLEDEVEDDEDLYEGEVFEAEEEDDQEDDDPDIDEDNQADDSDS